MRTPKLILAFIFAFANAFAATGDGPPPAAAGDSPSVKAPPPKADEFDETPLESLRDPVVDNDELPEPFFCHSVLQTNEGKDEWIYVSSDYPREIPPFKNQVLSPAFSRQENPKSTASWGTCTETKENKSESVIDLVVYAHYSTATSSPDVKKCAWVPKGKVTSQKMRLKVGEWSGIEFQPKSGQKVRFSAHWPTKTQDDATGDFCRQFALSMNNKSFEANRFKKLKF